MVSVCCLVAVAMAAAELGVLTPSFAAGAEAWASETLASMDTCSLGDDSDLVQGVPRVTQSLNVSLRTYTLSGCTAVLGGRKACLLGKGVAFLLSVLFAVGRKGGCSTKYQKTPCSDSKQCKSTRTRTHLKKGTPVPCLLIKSGEDFFVSLSIQFVATAYSLLLFRHGVPQFQASSKLLFGSSTVSVAYNPAFYWIANSRYVHAKATESL